MFQHRQQACQYTPWQEILNSNEVVVPQWIQCSSCRKWRVIHIATAIISRWKEPSNWRCAYNRCDAPQETPNESKYSVLQLCALTIQRNLKIQKSDQNQNNENPFQASYQQNSNKRRNIFSNSTMSSFSVPTKKLRLNQQSMEDFNDSKLMIQNEKLKLQIIALNDKNEELQKENEEFNEELKLLNGNIDHIAGWNQDKLQEMELKLQNGIKIIHEAKERLLEDKLYCIACLKNQKNVVINGCNHIDLCHQCEHNLHPKVCPRCQVPFTSIIRLNI